MTFIISSCVRAVWRDRPLAWKLGIGFGALCVLVLGMGFLTARVVRQVGQKANFLATTVFADSALATKTAADFRRTMLSMRTFGLTYNPDHYKAGMAALTDVRADADRIVEHSDTQEETQQAHSLAQQLSDFDILAKNTAECATAIVSDRDSLNGIARQFAPLLDEHLAAMRRQFVIEIDGAEPAEKLHERAWKIDATIDAIRSFNQIQMAAWNGLASGDDSIFAQVTEQFSTLTDVLTKLRASHSKVDDQVRIAKALTAGATYHDSVLRLRASLAAVGKINRSRGAAAESMAANLADLAKANEKILSDTLATMNGAMSGLLRMVLGVTAGVMVLGALIAVILTRLITRPLHRTTVALQAVAKGDLTQHLTISSRDEIGRLGEALNATVGILRNHHERMDAAAKSLAAASEELNATSNELVGNADATTKQVTSMAANAEQVSANVRSVAAGTEEMSISVQEIAKNASTGAQIAGEASAAMIQVNTVITALGTSSQQIGQVVSDINAIAEQTNLLALNATIEAARAGEAGRGFAVVASEVKELARQTAKATGDIRARIEEVQRGVASAVASISSVTAVIARINELNGSIAAAVEEQAATTSEITRSMSEVATGAQGIAASITGVADRARATSDGASNTRAASGELAKLSTELEALVAG